MWKTLGKAVAPILRESLILTPENVLQQQLRTTYILKRRNSPFLNKNGSLPKRLKAKHYIYDLVEDTNVNREPDMNVILTTYVAGLGDVGDKVAVRPNYAYNKLLMTGQAVYASPENVEKFKDYQSNIEEKTYSSATSQRAVDCLSRVTLSIIMNKETPWVLKPWHVKASFRKCGYWVPEETIVLPTNPITGPNLELENKEFFVTITVNNMEKVNVRCKIHHWTTEVVDRLPHEKDFWKKKLDPVFSEDAAILAELTPNKGLNADQ
ncbi:PREDICTED: 39S ribosomal protein L9, mitochondrial [Nicrophorus vespilloides]|uniref:Large ribosomal subunit protein bL9m n=1 Tax=Nicrophorus vespilloides TaxID=110193 RepID=A0ABM1NEM4_NICVS|nr:PREDICTED: 39S ribosomal protein L9, mitochondrial [Nicrophorus vespilloides]